jgi:hypothetical protein
MFKIILICGDIPGDMAGEKTMDYARLHIDGHQASAEFLWYYFTNNRDTELAVELMQKGRAHTQILPNGIYTAIYYKKRLTFSYDATGIFFFRLLKAIICDIRTKSELETIPAKNDA